MGPALSGLDQLLHLPMGCGEQNMLLFAPNIYVLEYLTNTQQLTPSLQEKALGFMRTGLNIFVIHSLSLLTPPATAERSVA